MTREPEKRPAFEPPTRLLVPTGYDPDMPRPAATVAGVVLVMLRVVAGAAVLIGIGFGWSDFVVEFDIVGLEEVPGLADVALVVVVSVGAAVLALDTLLAIFIYRGRNWARVFVMVVSTVSISWAFFAWWAQGQEITLQGTFASLSLDILILLALSSRSAAAYARRNERR